MPIEKLIDHPDFGTLTDVGAGMLFRLASWYWQTGCQSLPAADYDLRNICRSHPNPWRRLKPIVLGIFESARPELDAYKRKRDAAHRGLSNAGQMANSTMRLNALRKSNTPAPLPIHATGIVPRRLPDAPKQEDKPVRRAMVDRPKR